MFRVSNNVVGVVNVLTLLISLPILGFAAYLYLDHHSDSNCETFVELPLLVCGCFLLVVSLLGLVGSCCRVTFFLWIYLFVMFVLIVGLFCFTVFTFVVTNKGAGDVISGRGYKEYKLGDYSHWLQKRVSNAANWEKISSCLHDANVCRSLGSDVLKETTDFYKKNLSPIQSGCCKPPTYCGFTYVNATYWTKPKSGKTISTGDCGIWNNNQEQLCYHCNSCKAGFLANVKKEWRKLAIINICILIFLIIVYSVGCCAFRNNRADKGYNRHRPVYY